MSVSDLCQRCGLCCDGSLFAYVSLSADEGQRLIERDVAVGLREDGTFRLPQRCSALEGTRCRVYEARPDGCRAFECLLAIALRENETSLDAATAIVTEAKAHLAALDAASGNDGAPVAFVRRSMAGEAPALSDSAQAAWHSAREFLRRHFVGRHGLS